MNIVLTKNEFLLIESARKKKIPTAEISTDLGKTKDTVEVFTDYWLLQGVKYTEPKKAKDNTIYYWDGTEFSSVARFENSLIKLVPTVWGAPTFQIDGVKMLPTSKKCAYQDAKEKVELIQPKGKVILDTCGGLGYFSAWCVKLKAREIYSYEINPDVLWIREYNPWSPKIGEDNNLKIKLGNIAEVITTLESNSVDAILHDPPRFSLAGDLYSQVFYDHLARVIKKNGTFFHYTGTPNKLTSGRNVPNEVSQRLKKSGFKVKLHGDGLICTY